VIRTVPTGDLGLDVLLGGGWRLVVRLAERASVTVLVRGGSGVGKTLVGLNAALSLAEALDGDVIVACVELLPIEYVAQVRSARPDIDASRVVALPGAILPAKGPRVLCALLTELDPQAPDLVAGLESLADDLAREDTKPVVFVVDSLIEGYGIGTSSPRPSADALMKFAAQRGVGLVLCEEASGDERSPWVFAADTVLDLGMEPRERGRWCEVRKHRFGPSITGRHELVLGGWGPPRVFPQPHAWVSQDCSDVLRAHGWTFIAGPRGTPPLVFDKALAMGGEDGVEGAVTLVSSDSPELSRAVAFGLVPADASSRGGDLVLELESLLLREDGWSSSELDVHYVPTVGGAARALRALLLQFARVSESSGLGVVQRHRRVLLGDLGLVLSSAEAFDWVEAVRVFCTLAIESGWGVPIVLHDGHATENVSTEARQLLAANVDARIHVKLDNEAHARADVIERWRPRHRRLLSAVRVEAFASSAVRLPRLPGRGPTASR
jgi:hypothetical protein